MRISSFENFITEKKKKKGPCWDGYTMVGMKEKDGKEVPNCVPNKDKKIKEPVKQKNEAYDELNNYMFFQNLETIKNHVSGLLEYNETELDNLLSEHDWAQDHISTAKESIDQVYDFVMNKKESSEERFSNFDNFKQNEAKEKDSRLKSAGVEGYNKPKRTPNHPTKSHIVVAKEGDKVKTIRFGEQGAKTAGKPKEGESEAMKKKRKSFKARHAKNIKKGKMSAAYWADKVKW